MSTGVREYVELPDGLADMPPGPALSALLAELDPTCYTGNQLAILLSARYRQVCFEQAQMLRTVRELSYSPATAEGRTTPIRDTSQDPFTSVAMSFATTWTEYMAGLMVDLAILTVDTTPALGQALAEGRVDLDKVKVIFRELALIDDDEVRRRLVDQILADTAFESTGSLRARLRRFIAKLDPDAVRKRREQSVEDRDVTHAEYADGTASITASFLDQATAAAAYNHIDTVAKATHTAGDPLGRTLGQLRADVCADLLTGVDLSRAGYATPADRKGTINLTIDLMTLARLADEPGEIAGFGPVAAEMARTAVTQLGQLSTWRYIITHEGEVVAEATLGHEAVTGIQGELLRYAVDHTTGADGRNHYRPTAAQIAFIRARDKTCQTPGCRRPAHQCDIDHRLDWDNHGPTLVDAMAPLCRRHHNSRHQGGYTIERNQHGTIWTTPHGHKYLRVPDGTLFPHPNPASPTAADLHSGQCIGAGRPAAPAIRPPWSTAPRRSWTRGGHRGITTCHPT